MVVRFGAMGRGIATGVLHGGILLVEGGKALAWLAGTACVVIGVIGVIRGNLAYLLLAFPGAPAVAGLVNAVISLPGALLVMLGARLRGETLADYY